MFLKPGTSERAKQSNMPLSAGYVYALSPRPWPAV